MLHVFSFLHFDWLFSPLYINLQSCYERLEVGSLILHHHRAGTYYIVVFGTAATRIFCTIKHTKTMLSSLQKCKVFANCSQEKKSRKKCNTQYHILLCYTIIVTCIIVNQSSQIKKLIIVGEISSRSISTKNSQIYKQIQLSFYHSMTLTCGFFAFQSERLMDYQTMQ